MDKRMPKKGDAAPLEGVVGREIAGVLNLAFMAIGLGMLQNLGMRMGQGLSAPAANIPRGGAPSMAAPKAQVSTFAAPRAPKM